MCTEVIVEGKRCETIGQLEEAVGGGVVFDTPNGQSLGPEYCLCSVDIEGTAGKHGFAVARSDDPFIYAELQRP